LPRLSERGCLDRAFVFVFLAGKSRKTRYKEE
jgi:hypothetical protein